MAMSFSLTASKRAEMSLPNITLLLKAAKMQHSKLDCFLLHKAGNANKAVLQTQSLG